MAKTTFEQPDESEPFKKLHEYKGPPPSWGVGASNYPGDGKSPLFVHYGATPPSETWNVLWYDVSISPTAASLRYWDGSEWVFMDGGTIPDGMISPHADIQRSKIDRPAETDIIKNKESNDE